MASCSIRTADLKQKLRIARDPAKDVERLTGVKTTGVPRAEIKKFAAAVLVQKQGRAILNLNALCGTVARAWYAPFKPV